MLTAADTAKLVQWVADSGCREEGGTSQEHCAARPEDICVLTSPAGLAAESSDPPLLLPAVCNLGDAGRAPKTLTAC